jgi:hypothetical protein
MMAKQEELVKETGIEVSVDLDGLDEKHNWLALAVYFFNKSGHLLDQQSLTKDSSALSLKRFFQFQREKIRQE